MPTIYVSLKSGGKKPELKLRDSEGHNPGNDDITTDVDAGATVIWELDTNSGLSGICGITKKSESGNNDLLTANPTSTEGKYQGTIVTPSPGKGKKEKYKICFTIPNDTTQYWDDPKLNMKN